MAFRVDQDCLVAVLVLVEVRDAGERILYSDSPVPGVEVKVRDVAFGVELPCHVANRIVPHGRLVVKRIDDLALPVDGIERGVSRNYRLSPLSCILGPFRRLFCQVSRVDPYCPKSFKPLPLASNGGNAKRGLTALKLRARANPEIIANYYDTFSGTSWLSCAILRVCSRANCSIV